MSLLFYKLHFPCPPRFGRALIQNASRLKNPSVCLSRTDVTFSIFMWGCCNAVVLLPDERTAYCRTLNIVFIFLTLFILLVNMDLLLTVGTAVLGDCPTALVRCIKDFPGE